MNAWILAVIFCSGSPQPGGAHCISKPVEYGVSRGLCMSELERWTRRFARLHLQCTQDAQLVAKLKEQDHHSLTNDERMDLILASYSR